MDIENIIKTLEKLASSTLPDTFIWVIIVVKFILIPAGKRLNGLSAYIRRYLVIQRQQARAFEKLSKDVSVILSKMPKVSRRGRRTDYARTMPIDNK